MSPKLKEIIDDILSCLAKIAATNLTIRWFDKTKSFVYETIGCTALEIENDVLWKLSHFPTDSVKNEFQSFKNFTMQSYPDNIQKFASAKTYFATQFNRSLKTDYSVDLQINNHKQDLARILKVLPFPADFFNVLLELILK